MRADVKKTGPRTREGRKLKFPAQGERLGFPFGKKKNVEKFSETARLLRRTRMMLLVRTVWMMDRLVHGSPGGCVMGES